MTIKFVFYNIVNTRYIKHMCYLIYSKQLLQQYSHIQCIIPYGFTTQTVETNTLEIKSLHHILEVQHFKIDAFKCKMIQIYNHGMLCFLNPIVYNIFNIFNVFNVFDVFDVF